MALIVTPRSNCASRAASSYGATAASSPNRRAKEPQMRPGSTPRRSSKGRRSCLHGEQRYRAGEACSRPQCASQETGRAS